MHPPLDRELTLKIKRNVTVIGDDLVHKDLSKQTVYQCRVLAVVLPHARDNLDQDRLLSFDQVIHVATQLPIMLETARIFDVLPATKIGVNLFLTARLCLNGFDINRHLRSPLIVQDQLQFETVDQHLEVRLIEAC